MSGPAKGKEGDPRERGRKKDWEREKREWIGELEQRKLITRPVALSWLDYLVGREENILAIGPARRDHSPTRYSILHDPTASKNST